MQETAQLAADLLQQSAAIIGTTVEGLWPYYVHQAQITGMEAYIIGGLLGAFGLASMVIGMWLLIWEDDETGIGFAGLALILLLIGTMVMVDGWKHRANPEYYAIHYMMEDVGDLVGGQ